MKIFADVEPKVYFGSGGGGGAGAQTDVQSQEATARARMNFITSDFFRAGAEQYKDALVSQMQQFDVEARQALGSTALVMARSGNMTRSSRTIQQNTALGVDPRIAGEGYRTQLETLQEERKSLTKQLEEITYRSDGSEIKKLESGIEAHLDLRPEPPKRDDYVSTNYESYNSDLSEWQGCKDEEEKAATDARQKKAQEDAQERVGDWTPPERTTPDTTNTGGGLGSPAGDDSGYNWTGL